jgi:hypothetical protein
MTLKKIKNFSETREAAAFADAIEHRASGAALFAAPANQWQAPALKSSVIVA